MRKLVEAMGGRVWCESELGNGATFVVELPIIADIHYATNNYQLMTSSEAVFWCAFALYCVNLVVGIVAQLRWYHFGRAHHVLYFVVFAAAVAAVAVQFHPALVVTLLALAALPKSKPGTLWHPALAVVGFVGYCIAATVVAGYK